MSSQLETNRTLSEADTGPQTGPRDLGRDHALVERAMRECDRSYIKARDIADDVPLTDGQLARALSDLHAHDVIAVWNSPDASIKTWVVVDE